MTPVLSAENAVARTVTLDPARTVDGVAESVGPLAATGADIRRIAGSRSAIGS